MTDDATARDKLIVLSFRDHLRSGWLEGALSALTTMERGDLIGLVNRALTEDGGIDGTRLAASERQRAEGWLDV